LVDGLYLLDNNPFSQPEEQALRVNKPTSAEELMPWH